ncbi:PREDICTED: deoxyguanosine kinase, mitochondrial-like [Thamnophis sirtalis]|uniref:Deoxyguanosine kinase, mitochondrial-like n=1 Tax=Thamnophis sirtalis TaxID=35019 RepID=A0A6I9YGX0_9SAUR|nr:PREDICTED: deoxyguanosine kinase, mitochondrial-like [Thamnophis sirtalis]
MDPPGEEGLRMYIFAKNLFEIGHMTEIEWIIYQDWHTFLLQTFGDQLALHGFLYLQAPPEVCFERLRCRSRPEEKEVQLSYLEQLHVQHENWLVKKTSVSHSGALRDVPVLILDVTKDFENDPNEQSKLIGQVNFFMKTLCSNSSPSISTTVCN